MTNHDKFKIMRQTLVLTIVMHILFALNCGAKEYILEENIPYSNVRNNLTEKNAESGDYIARRCKLDVYYTPEFKDNPVVVWFHGGGLTGGEKFIPDELKNDSLVVVAVNYRLLPDADIDEVIDDAAAAVAWTFNNIESYGGSPERIFLAGHSAGGYLLSMIGLDKKYLEKYGVDADRIAALVPYSGQVLTHYAVRERNGLGPLAPRIDEYAPLYHVRKDCPPYIIISGDRNEELFGRYEENAYMWRLMDLIGHPDVYLYELQGFNHGDMASPAHHILKNHINDISSKQYYTNPVLGINFPDPTFIKGDDGYFYAYSTQGRLGDIPIFRSPDLVNWEYVSCAFPKGSVRPAVLPDGAFWAPDIIKLGDKYVLVYSQSKWGEETLNGLGLAVADSPTGPFIDLGKLFTSEEIGVRNSIDPAFVLTDDNDLYLLWGSFSGLFMIELDADNLTVKDGAEPFQVAGNAFEGSHVFKHDGKYYLFASVGTCCEGDNSTYRVKVGRSDSPMGPYMDRNGQPMLENNATLVVEGDEYSKGPGHGSQITTDDNGRTWYLYHGYINGRSKEGRMMWLDEILWDDEGWPYIEGNKPSHTLKPKPKFNKKPQK